MFRMSLRLRPCLCSVGSNDTLVGSIWAVNFLAKQARTRAHCDWSVRQAPLALENLGRESPAHRVHCKAGRIHPRVHLNCELKTRQAPPLSASAAACQRCSWRARSRVSPRPLQSPEQPQPLVSSPLFFLALPQTVAAGRATHPRAIQFQTRRACAPERTDNPVSISCA